MLKIKDIYNLELGKLMHKVNSGIIPKLIGNEFKKLAESHSHFTRLQSGDNYYLPRANTSYGQKALAFRGTKFRTELDTKIKKLNWFSFKKSLKNLLLSTYSI